MAIVNVLSGLPLVADEVASLVSCAFRQTVTPREGGKGGGILAIWSLVLLPLAIVLFAFAIRLLLSPLPDVPVVDAGSGDFHRLLSRYGQLGSAFPASPRLGGI